MNRAALPDRLTCRLFFYGCAILVWLGAESVYGQTQPEQFPDVELIEESQPRYAAISLDAWGQSTAYVLFDGNNEVGYGRVYVWVPGDAQFGTPVAFNAGQGNRYPPLRRRTDGEEGEVSELTWTLGWGYHHTGGTHFNYTTGESVTRQRGRSARFPYTLDYVRDRPATAGSRLHLTINGFLPVTGDWTEVRAGSRPWNAIRTMVNVTRHIDRDQIILRLTGRLIHQNNRLVAVESLPEPFFEVNVSVSPYMKNPLYAEALRFRDLFHSGVEIRVEPRWYSINWDYQMHPWLGSATRRDSHFRSVGRVE